MPTPTTQKTRNPMWEVNCVPECGFMVREHNQTSLVNIVQTHVRTVHPGQTVPDQKGILGMAKKL